VKRFAVLTSCLLFACSLDVPGTGPAQITEDGEHVEDTDSITVAVGAGTTAGAGAATSTFVPSGAAPVSSLDAGVSVVAADGGPNIVSSTTSDGGTTTRRPPAQPGAFSLSSSAFDDGARLPSAFTCRGADNSPPLSWSNAPLETRSFALVMTSKSAAKPDDAPSVEWVVWSIPATRSSLPEGVAAGSEPSNVPGAHQDARDDDSQSGSAGGFTGVGGALAGANFGGVAAGVGAGIGGVGLGGTFAGNWGGGGVSPAIPVGGVSVPFNPTGSTRPAYHGPCGSSGVSNEFTLFALDAAASAQWGSFVSIETVSLWLRTRSNVLAQASLLATYP
jgi:phosphatidylethanolamine-binding protein (PEBP) family uncharacterized protein